MRGLDFSLGRSAIGLNPGVSALRRRVFDFTTGTMPPGAALSRAGSGLSFGASGGLGVSGANLARFDHDPATGVLLGLLIEPGATNIVPNSAPVVENLNISACTAANLALNALGVFPGVQVISDGSSWGRVRHAAEVGAGKTYAITCYLRAGTSGRARFVCSAGSSETVVAGPIGALANTRSDLGTCTSINELLLADGLTRRLRMVFDSTYSGAATFGLGMDSGVAGQTVIYLGMQVEEGAAASSFILNGNTPVARAADQLSLTGLSGRFDLTLDYAGGGTGTISGATVAPGYIVATTGRHLRRITAVPG